MRRSALIGCILALGGPLAACGVTPMRSVRVPVPVECRAEVPLRPAMPTEGLSQGVDLDRFVAASLAEIELREGYEGELRTALESCAADVAR